MTDRSTFPITLREASSLEDAFGLFQKAIAVIRAVNARLGELGYPDWMVMSQAGQTGWLTSKLHEQIVPCHRSDRRSAGALSPRDGHLTVGSDPLGD